MHCFSKHVVRPFAEALACTKEALERHGFAVLGEIDVRKALKGYLGADFRPYVILSACSLKLAKDAIDADADSGPMLLSNVVVQECAEGYVEILVIDPAATIGTINDVRMIQVAAKLRRQLSAVIDEIDTLAEREPGWHRQAARGPTLPTEAAR
jgi:uncharacterized protein (DUF302 family)